MSATYVLTIAGVTRTIQRGTLEIIEALNSKAVLTFDLLDRGGSYRPSLDDEVLITENGTRIFGGTIDKIRERAHPDDIGGDSLLFTVTCEDFSGLAAWRRINTAIPAGTSIKDALDIYILPYYSGYGVTLHASQATGVALDGDLKFDYANGAEALDEIAKRAGSWTWRIDYNKVLRVYDPSTASAPFNIALNDGNTVGDVVVEPSREDYINILFVRYNELAQRAYAFFNASGATVGNGETVVIGSRTYTFQTTLTDVNGNVHIGATLADSIHNLVNAINLGAGAGTDYASATTQNTQVEAILLGTDVVKVRAITAGAAGNGIGVSTTVTGAHWHTEGSVSTSTLTFGSDESLTNVTTSFGFPHTIPREDVIVVPTSDATDAAAKGFAEITRRAALRQTVEYPTRRLGIYPGQSQTIVLAKRNLNAAYHVTRVVTRDDLQRTVERTVTLAKGTVVLTSYQDTYGTWNSKSSSTVAGNGGNSGAGGGFSGGGAARKLAVWNSSTVLVDGIVSDDGQVATVAGQIYAPATTTTSRTLIAQASAFGVSHYVTATPVAGAHVSFASEIAGSASGGSPLYKIAGYFAGQSGANGDDIFGINAIAQWNASHTASNIIGVEIDVANNNSDCGINQTPWVDGLLIVSGGSKKPHAAIHIYCSASTNKWVKGIEISNNPYETGFEPVSHTGIEVGGPSSSSLIGSGVFRQLVNGEDTLLMQRRTNTAPTGFFLRAVDASANNLFAVGVAGSMTMAAASASIEIGSSASSNTPFIDFHSSANANDYDARILASGGSSGDGLGDLTVTCTNIVYGGHLDMFSPATGISGAYKAAIRNAHSAGLGVYISGGGSSSNALVVDDYQGGGTKRLLVLSGLGALQLTQMTATTWVTGDKYLVIDASGNVHRSAIGPAS